MGKKKAQKQKTYALGTTEKRSTEIPMTYLSWIRLFETLAQDLSKVWEAPVCLQ